MDNSPQGGVVNLLRMARTQCGVAIAFAALRKADGSFALAVFPQPAPESAWTIEAIDELVHQTWADPHLNGGRVLVRSCRTPGTSWPGQNEQTKLAVAPLSDLASADRPWGLLCVAGPTSGQFEQEQLDLLGTMAVRLTSYLRARQEVVENVFTVVGADPDDDHHEPDDQPEAAPAAEPAVASTLDSSDPLGRPASAGAVPQPVAPAWSDLGATTATPDPLGGAPEGWLAELSARPRPPETPPWPVAPRGYGLSDLATSFPAVEWYRGGESEPARAPRPEVTQTIRGAGDAIGTMLRPDPLTGLVGLPAVLVHIGAAVGGLRAVVTGAVAVVLVDVMEPGPAPQPLPDAAFGAVAERLRGNVRSSDVVGRIGHGTFAVVASVRHGSEDGPVIERRLVDAAKHALALVPGVTVRSSLATATASTPVAPEDLMREAITRLGAQ
jgi:hypothetical protein